MKYENLLELDLGEANPKQALFYASRTLYTAYGGARGGGKTHAVRIKALGGALSWAGIRILIVRRTYPELRENHIAPIRRMVPSELGKYNEAAYTMYFANGSTIRFGHYNGDGSADEYQGQEYDWIFMDEATQFTERQFRTLGGCLRGVNDIPKRFYLTCNPGGVGHQWVKRLFIDRRFKTGCDNEEENERPEDYSFIAATVEDNVHLMKASPAYVQMLSALPESLRKAHRYGDWSALSGAYFSEFSNALHVIEPFRIPPEWPRYRSIDYGLDMLACYWVAVDCDGRCYVYRELTAPNLIASEAAERILECTLPGEEIVCTFTPPDLWSRQKDTGKTIADVLMAGGINILKADNNRVQGHLQIKELLKSAPDGRPMLLISRDCPRLIENLRDIQTDEKNPNDCARAPHELTHTVDALRYFAISRTLSAEESEPETGDEIWLEGYDEMMLGGEIDEGYLRY